MNIRPINPQEIAAQAADAKPRYGGEHIEQEQKDKLRSKAQEFINLLNNPLPATLSDEELLAKLNTLKQQAISEGVWDPSTGNGSEERLSYLNNFKVKNKQGELVPQYTEEYLQSSGYLEGFRELRRVQEWDFNSSFKYFQDDHPMDPEAEALAISELQEKVIDLKNLSEEDRNRLKESFPSGNFLFHSAEAEQIIKILDTGVLANFTYLYEEERKKAEQEGREPEFLLRHTGSEGISYSWNNIGAMPGDRFHIAGILTSPEKALADDEQLAIPSRPAPNELLQLPGVIDCKKFFFAKVQTELYGDPYAVFEDNTVYSNFKEIRQWTDPDKKDKVEPQLLTALNGILAKPSYPQLLREHYELDDNGDIIINPNLIQNYEENIPVAAVWLQAAIDTGRFEGTPFAGKDVREIIMEAADNEHVRRTETGLNLDVLRLSWLSNQEAKKFQVKLEEAQGPEKFVTVPTENTYLVVADKDLHKWLQVLARVEKKPAGIILYDGKEVRLENFASAFKGDQEKLTEQLRTAIPAGNGFIDYSEVLGSELSDEMLAGYNRQVIAQEYLNDTKVVRKDAEGKLIVTA